MTDREDPSPFPPEMEQLGFGDSFAETLCGMLEGIHMFDGFNRREIEMLSGFIQAYQAKSGTTIFAEGGRSSYMCFVAEGKLDVLKAQDEDEQRKLATVRAGKTIGEMALIDQLPHSASVVSTTQSTLLLLTKQNFLNLADQHPRLAFRVLWKITQLISHRLRQTSGILVDYL